MAKKQEPVTQSGTPVGSVLYADRPFFQEPEGWLRAQLVAVPDTNQFAIVLDSGEVLSVQPGGEYDTRPAGTFGAYEKATKVGDKLVYSSNGTYHVVAIVEGV